MIKQYIFITIAVVAAIAYLAHRLLRWGGSAGNGCGGTSCRCDARPPPDDDNRLPAPRETIQLGSPKPSNTED